MSTLLPPEEHDGRIPLQDAWGIASSMVEMIEPAVKRAEIGGSVRRKRPWVKDVELLIEPRYRTRILGLFGETETVSIFQERLRELVESGTVSRPTKWGERYIQLAYRAVTFDLFIRVPPAQWGLLMLLRTGPRDFSRQAVMPRTQRFMDSNGEYRHGLLPPGYSVSGGCVHRGTTPIPTPSEEDVFRIFGIAYVPPERRA